jgi:ammonia channel protein AmtB
MPAIVMRDLAMLKKGRMKKRACMRSMLAVMIHVCLITAWHFALSHGLLFESCKKETVSFLLLLALTMTTFRKWKGNKHMEGGDIPDILNTK